MRIGIDLGGSKIAGICIDHADRVVSEGRCATPQNNYDDTIRSICDLVDRLEAHLPGDKASRSIGIGTPGSLSPRTGRIQNANSVWLNDRPLGRDLETALGRPVRLANDADCFILSEAHDGAAADAGIAFGVILGTGCGGGIVIDRALISGPRRIAGEWGHNPLPSPLGDEHPGPLCWCGRHGCMETWVSGPALAADHARTTGVWITVEEIAAAAHRGEANARRSLDRHASRLARGLAAIVNVLDPHVIVFGGGLSALDHLYRDLPGLIAPHVFADDATVQIRPPRWGGASGVRGAARLWEDRNRP